MNARNPDTQSPARRTPWETPADLPVCDLQPYAHQVRLGLACRQIAKHMDAAAVAFKPVEPGVWCNDVPFASCREAALFLLNAGVVTGTVNAVWVAIKRAAAIDGQRYGFRWRREEPPVAPPVVPLPPRPMPERTMEGKPRVREWATPVEYCGVRYPSIRAAARKLRVKPKTLWMRIDRQRAKLNRPEPVRMWELNWNCPASG